MTKPARPAENIFVAVVKSTFQSLGGHPELALIFGALAIILAFLLTAFGVIGDKLDAGWRFFLLTLFVVSMLTMLATLWAKRRAEVIAERNVPEPPTVVLERFNREIRPLLKRIRATCHGQCSVAETRALVIETVETVSRIALQRDDLPELTIPGMPSFEPGTHVNCGICGGEDVGITRAGQCPRCKLHCAFWNGHYTVEGTTTQNVHPPS